MKNLILIALVALAFQVVAQKNNVQSAANSLKYDEYEEGKKYIDLATVHPKTVNDPKMWYYRGKVYLAIHDKKKAIDPDAIRKSTESLMKCLEIDERKMFTDSARVYLMRASISCFYEGLEKYKVEDYKYAGELYDLVLKTLVYDENKDLARNNVSEKNVYLYMYYAANGAKDKVKEKQYLEKLIELNYNDPRIYIYMSRLYQEEKDTATALQYVEKGRDRFYDDNSLIGEQVNLSLKLGKGEDLLAKITEDIGYDPGNAILFMVRGMLYEKKEDLENAAKDYKESLVINPDNFNANFNLGIMYYNEGATIMGVAKDILDNNKYNAEKTKADAKFREALPFFEAAHEIDPKDEIAAQSLLRLYPRLGETEKYTKLKEKLTNE